MKSEVLLESRTLRDEVVAKTYVLEKVKFLRLLPDNQHATTEMVANFYEVPVNTVRQVLVRHKDEFKEEGVKKVTRKELYGLPEFASDKLSLANIGNKVRNIVLIPRRGILRVGMLLEGSEVAKKVRDYLLNAEHATTAQDIERIRAEIELLERKYSFKKLEIEHERIQAEREQNMRLLEAALNLPLPAEFQQAIISRVAGVNPQPVVKTYTTEQLAGQFTFEFGTRITGKRISMLATENGIRINDRAGERENQFSFMSVTPAVNKKTGKTIEGKIVEQVLYKETAVPVLRMLVKQWLDDQPEKKKKPRKVVKSKA